MQAAFTMVKNLDRTREGKGDLQIRLTDAYPDRSLIMVNRVNENGDVDYGKGVVLFNSYPKQSGSRGLEGGMGNAIRNTGDSAEQGTEDPFMENVTHFNTKWDHAKRITVAQVKPIEVFSIISDEAKIK